MTFLRQCLAPLKRLSVHSTCVARYRMYNMTRPSSGSPCSSGPGEQSACPCRLPPQSRGTRARHDTHFRLGPPSLATAYKVELPPAQHHHRQQVEGVPPIPPKLALLSPCHVTCACLIHDACLSFASTNHLQILAQLADLRRPPSSSSSPSTRTRSAGGQCNNHMAAIAQYLPMVVPCFESLGISPPRRVLPALTLHRLFETFGKRKRNGKASKPLQYKVFVGEFAATHWPLPC
jgi:hypothetical protein